MKTQIITESEIEQAVKWLSQGELVAFPTETVYGLGANAFDASAVAKIYTAKGRPSTNPLIVHIATIKQIEAFAFWTPMAEKLAAAFWPGPLTIVLPAKPQSRLAKSVLAGLETVAVRMPAYPVAQKLLQASDFPVAAPSANRSGHVSATEADHVLDDLEGRIAGVLDGGESPVGLESTIISCVDDPVILRSGSITAQEIEAVLGTGLKTEDVYLSPMQDKPQSPGQLSSHYAPKAEVRLNQTQNGKGEQMLGFGPDCPDVPGLNLSPSGNLEEAAANLYAYLRILDETGVAVINVMPVPEVGLGVAINDRLKRAAAPR